MEPLKNNANAEKLVQGSSKHRLDSEALMLFPSNGHIKDIMLHATKTLHTLVAQNRLEHDL
eukprot:15473196-Alexandrium_andersonii.AAC.1